MPISDISILPDNPYKPKWFRASRFVMLPYKGISFIGIFPVTVFVDSGPLFIVSDKGLMNNFEDSVFMQPTYVDRMMNFD